MVAESLVSMLPTPRPVQFPGDPPPTLSRVEQRQSETSREQTRVSLTAFSDTDVEPRQQRCTPPPPTLPVSGALTQSCVGGCPTLFASTPLHLGRCNTHPKSGAEQTGELWVLVCLQVKSSALRVQYDSNPKRRRGVVSQSHDKKGAEKA